MLLSCLTRKLLIVLSNRHAIGDVQQWIFYLLTSYCPLALIAIPHKIIPWSLTVCIKVPFFTGASSAPPLLVCHAQESCLVAHVYPFFPERGQFNKRGGSLSQHSGTPKCQYLSSGCDFSLLLTVTDSVVLGAWFLGRRTTPHPSSLTGCFALNSRSPVQGRSNMICCPKEKRKHKSHWVAWAQDPT